MPAGSGIDSLAGLVVDGPLARTVADAALLLDGMIARVHGAIDHHYTLRAPDDDDGPLLGAAIRGEGRFQLGVMTTSAWDDAYEITLDPAALGALDEAVLAFDALGHGIEQTALEHDETYAPAFRTIWQAGAARIPAEGDALDLLEPLTRWLVLRGRELSARQLSEALTALTAYERSLIRQLVGLRRRADPGDGDDPAAARLVRPGGRRTQLRPAGAVHAVHVDAERERAARDRAAGLADRRRASDGRAADRAARRGGDAARRWPASWSGASAGIGAIRPSGESAEDRPSAHEFLRLGMPILKAICTGQITRSTPRRTAHHDDRVQYLVVGDESSLAELESELALLPLCARGRVFIEVERPEDVSVLVDSAAHDGHLASARRPRRRTRHAASPAAGARPPCVP